MPAEGWVHVDPVLSGICGSDLATLDGRSSRYFEDIVSFPFVPGHEVVGTLTEDAVGAEGWPAGRRQPGRPAAGARVRRPWDRTAVPRLPSRATWATADHVAFGHIRPGLQTGFCADTGGGWSTSGLVAHSSQLYAVPDGLSDADAVTVEPVACAVHAVLGAPIAEGDVVAVVGAGTLGLLVTAALRPPRRPGALPAPVGRPRRGPLRASAAAGPRAGRAPRRCPPDQLARAVRRHSRSLSYGGASGVTATLSGGADVVIDCVGSPESIAQSLAMVRPRGTVALVGMPGKVTVDLAPLWHREVRLAGAYAYGTERSAGQRMTASRPSRWPSRSPPPSTPGGLVSATYPLARFEDAVAHAGAPAAVGP